ncbi:MAG: GNAT family N-acetyltransferase [Veillonellaceae bacterium]|nr:GNAT family N-acetyltransferase [Veillonellaceae bacterium]
MTECDFTREADIIRILGPGNAAEWRAAWTRLPAEQRDVFARWEYYDAFSLLEPSAIPECAVFDGDDGIILYPYFRRPLSSIDWLKAPEGAFDLSSAYGYGGFYGSTADRHLLDVFHGQFSAHCRATGVVADLIRVNPIVLDTGTICPPYSSREGNFQVVVDLQRSDAEIWASYKHNNRKNVNKALRSGVEIVREEGAGRFFPEFLSIYDSTMVRRGAHGFRFSPKFFERLLEGLGDKAQLFYALISGRVVSAELAILSETSMYSFLGGTDEAYFEFRPANLLKHEMIRWARDEGLSKFLLGGGPRGEDGVFEFKRSFAPDGVIRFDVAWRVHDHVLYGILVDRCRAHPPQSEASAERYPLRWRYGG